MHQSLTALLLLPLLPANSLVLVKPLLLQQRSPRKVLLQSPNINNIAYSPYIVVTYLCSSSGYNNADPPKLDGPNACPHCHLAPCVTARPLSWVRDSAEARLGNITKRFRRYRKFWTLLGQLGVWNHPEYLDYKRTKTSVFGM